MYDRIIINLLIAFHARRHEPDRPFTDYLKIIEARDEVLQRFQLEFRHPASLTADTFRDFLLFEHNQHWTGLHRRSSEVCADMDRLKTALTHLFDEAIPIESRFDALTDNPDIQVKYLGPGIITAALLVRFPDKYGVWNGKSEAAIRALNLWPARQRGTTDGVQYAAINQVFLKFARLVDVDLWSLDGLWHVVNEIGATEFENDLEKSEREEREYREGGKTPNSGFRTERNVAARQACVDSKGFTCEVCDFNFLQFYGEIGLHFIHVHHQDDLAQGERDTKPAEHLVPVCPNCHAMLHRGRQQSRSIKELREIIRKVREG